MQEQKHNNISKSLAHMRWNCKYYKVFNFGKTKKIKIKTASSQC